MCHLHRRSSYYSSYPKSLALSGILSFWCSRNIKPHISFHQICLAVNQKPRADNNFEYSFIPANLLRSLNDWFEFQSYTSISFRYFITYFQLCTVYIYTDSLNLNDLGQWEVGAAIIFLRICNFTQDVLVMMPDLLLALWF